MTSERPGVGRDSGYLLGGSAAAGLFVYAFVLVGVRSVGADQFAPVSLLWSYWLFAAAAVALPLQHWLIRASVIGTPRTTINRTVRRVGLVCFMVAALEFGLLLPFREQVFDDTTLVHPASFASMTIGAYTMGLARGRQAARGNYAWIGASQAGENGIRLAGAIVGALAGFGPQYFVILMPLGFLVAFLPPSALFAGVPLTDRGPQPGAGRQLVAIVGTTLIPQMLWAAGPFVVTSFDRAGATTTGLFLALALARLPNVLANAVGLRLLEWLSERSRDVVSIRRMVVAGGTGAAIATAAASAVVGPFTLRLVFGDDAVVSRFVAACVFGGGVAAVTVLLITLTLLAEERAGRAVAAGTVGLSSGALTVAIGTAASLDVTATTAAAFAVAQIVYLAGISTRPRNRSHE